MVGSDFAASAYVVESVEEMMAALEALRLEMAAAHSAMELNEPVFTNGADVVELTEGGTYAAKGGADIITGSDEDDEIFGNGGADEIDGEFGNDILYGNGGKDVLNGSFGDDFVYGGAKADEVDGGWGDDIVDGGKGNDEVRGSRGNDELSGGGGKDVVELFGFTDGEGEGIDHVTDFNKKKDVLLIWDLRPDTVAEVSVSREDGDTIIEYGSLGMIILDDVELKAKQITFDIF